MTDFVYDCETYPNFFSLTLLDPTSGNFWQFEISTRKNDAPQLLVMLYWLRDGGHRLVGFNNVGFDYPIIHAFIENASMGVGYSELYSFAMTIINTPFEQRFTNRVPAWKVIIPQVDLYMIHHFDNHARSTSLKRLEFNMRSKTVEDLPFPVGTVLEPWQMDVVLSYNLHDVKETARFLKHSQDMIDFRDTLTARYGHDFTNYNDTKIGKQYFIMRLEEANPGTCYVQVNGKRVMRQTPRDQIVINDILLPISFDTPEFTRVHDYFRSQTIRETKGVFDDLTAVVRGQTYHFGVGGMHMSIESQTVRDNDTHAIIDLDVTSYYPSLAIANNIYPEHLGQTFCEVYADLKTQRTQFKKGTAENAMLKLALNGVYGDSNNRYSPFYDPAYTMAITINGQLLLCKLAEGLMTVPGLEIIQMNTDGLTIRVERSREDHVELIKQWWQGFTGLELEEARYNLFAVRDVNNYVAQYVDGGVKRKGAYEYKLGWHQNHNARVVAMGAEAAILNGTDPMEFVTGHVDPFDFMLCTKITRTSALTWGEEEVQPTCRYYIAEQGEFLHKYMPPLKTSKTGDLRKMAINKGYRTALCNRAEDFNRSNVNFRWYADEINKLVEPLK